MGMTDFLKKPNVQELFKEEIRAARSSTTCYTGKAFEGLVRRARGLFAQEWDD